MPHDKEKTSSLSLNSTNQTDWEKILADEGLPPLDIEMAVDEQREAVMKTLRASINRNNHKLYSAPRSMGELFHDVRSAFQELHPQGQVLWKIHASCSFECDCIILAIQGKRAFHINTHLMQGYDPAGVIHFLTNIAQENIHLYE